MIAFSFLPVRKMNAKWGSIIIDLHYLLEGSGDFKGDKPIGNWHLSKHQGKFKIRRHLSLRNILMKTKLLTL